MRLLRRGFTSVKIKKRAPRSSNVLSLRSQPIKKDSVTSIVKQFHALSIDQRYRAVARVLQRNRNFDDEVEHFFREADTDKDGLVNHQEFRSFLTSRFKLQRIRSHPNVIATSHPNARPTNRQLKLVMIASAIPFVGFGFVDNILMLVAGDMIEDHFHEAYHLSMLCAAALGNTVANTVGLSLGGIIESFVRRAGIPDPHLSKAQAQMGITHWVNFIASAGGITLGCILGMFPLLFMNHKKYEDEIIAAEEAKRKALMEEVEQQRSASVVNDDVQCVAMALVSSVPPQDSIAK